MVRSSFGRFSVNKVCEVFGVLFLDKEDFLRVEAMTRETAQKGGGRLELFEILLATRARREGSEVLGGVSMLVSVTSDRFAKKVYGVRTTQYQEGQNKSARSTKLRETLEGHHQL